ncbi:Uncharacterised protein [Mycobacteroides abscessus]|nr:Uncharacterised protein [Mycobacteroides abscessus]
MRTGREAGLSDDAIVDVLRGALLDAHRPDRGAPH